MHAILRVWLFAEVCIQAADRQTDTGHDPHVYVGLAPQLLLNTKTKHNQPNQ